MCIPEVVDHGSCWVRADVNLLFYSTRLLELGVSFCNHLQVEAAQIDAHAVEFVTGPCMVGSPEVCPESICCPSSFA